MSAAKRSDMQPETGGQVPDRFRRLLVEKEKILSMTPEEALSRILEAPQPAALVHALGDMDFHFLVQQLGADRALPLLALASDGQIDHIFDLQVWQRDRLDTEAATRWLDRMLSAAPGRLARWALRGDAAFIELYLFRNIEVIVRGHDQDPSDFPDGFASLDETFYFRVRPLPPAATPEDDASQKAAAAERMQREKVLRALLQNIAAYDYPKYQHLLLELAALLPAEAEEELFRRRSVRLAEKGFLPFDEALGIYQPLKRKQLRPLPQAAHRKEDAASLRFAVPQYPLRMIASGSPLARALQLVADEMRRGQLQMEFAGLCNRIAVTDKVAVVSRQQLEDVGRKAVAYVGIGLAHLCGAAGAGRWAQILTDYGLVQVFRVGYGRALALKWRADEWLYRSWFRASGLGLSFWDEAWMGLLGGLFLKRPLFFDAFQAAGHYRDFMNLDEIRRTSVQLERIMAFDTLFAALDLPPAGSMLDTPLTFKNFLLTAWARHYLGMSATRTAPIARDAFARFFADLFEPSSGANSIRPAMKTIFLSWLSTRSGMTPDAISSCLAQALEDLFAEVQDEYGRLSPDDLDPRFLPHFLLD